MNFLFVIRTKESFKKSQLCNRRITTDEIVGFFDGKLEKDVTFVVDSHKSYIGIKKDLNIELKQVLRGKSMLDSVFIIFNM